MNGQTFFQKSSQARKKPLPPPNERPSCPKNIPHFRPFFSKTFFFSFPHKLLAEDLPSLIPLSLDFWDSKRGFTVLFWLATEILWVGVVVDVGPAGSLAGCGVTLKLLGCYESEICQTLHGDIFYWGLWPVHANLIIKVSAINKVKVKFKHFWYTLIHLSSRIVF